MEMRSRTCLEAEKPRREDVGNELRGQQWTWLVTAPRVPAKRLWRRGVACGRFKTSGISPIGAVDDHRGAPPPSNLRTTSRKVTRTAAVSGFREEIEAFFFFSRVVAAKVARLVTLPARPDAPVALKHSRDCR